MRRNPTLAARPASPLTAKEAAAVLGVGESALAYFRAAGIGPGWHFDGHRCLYAEEEVNAMARERSGMASLREMAERLGIPRRRLYMLMRLEGAPERRGRGGRAYLASEVEAWVLARTSEEPEALGLIPASEVAERLGISRSAVSFRKGRGLLPEPAFAGNGRAWWDPAEIDAWWQKEGGRCRSGKASACTTR